MLALHHLPDSELVRERDERLADVERLKLEPLSQVSHLLRRQYHRLSELDGEIARREAQADLSEEEIKRDELLTDLHVAAAIVARSGNAISPGELHAVLTRAIVALESR